MPFGDTDTELGTPSLVVTPSVTTESCAGDLRTFEVSQKPSDGCDDREQAAKEKANLSTFPIDADNSTTALMAQADLFFPGTGIPAIFTLTEKSVVLVVK